MLSTHSARLVIQVCPRRGSEDIRGPVELRHDMIKKETFNVFVSLEFGGDQFISAKKRREVAFLANLSEKNPEFPKVSAQSRKKKSKSYEYRSR